MVIDITNQKHSTQILSLLNNNTSLDLGEYFSQSTYHLSTSSSSSREDSPENLWTEPNPGVSGNTWGILPGLGLTEILCMLSSENHPMIPSYCWWFVRNPGKLTSWVLKVVEIQIPLVTTGFICIQTVVGNGISGCHQQYINSWNSYLATARGKKMPIKVHPYRDPGEWEHGTFKYL